MPKDNNLEGGIYDDGYLRVEYANYYATCGGHPIYSLARVEILLFFTLVRNFERLVTHEDLWESVWGHTQINVRTLRVQVSNLRVKLLPYKLNIISVVGMGYRLIKSDDGKL